MWHDILLLGIALRNTAWERLTAFQILCECVILSLNDDCSFSYKLLFIFKRLGVAN